MNDISQTCATITKKNLVLHFSGDVSSDFFVHILHSAEKELGIIEAQVRLRKKIFNILVEVLQNIYHYYNELENKQANNSVTVSLYKDNNNYCIFTGNHIYNDKVRSLKLLLDKINAFSKEELVEAYRKKLMTCNTSTTGRAGLGILDIKRKSGTNMLYQFQPVDKQYSFFRLIVRISA